MSGLAGVVLALALSQSQAWDQSVVAVKADPDNPAVIMKREDAEARFQELCKTPPSDARELAALAIALDKFPDWPAFVVKNDLSVCSPKTVDAQ